MKSNKGFKDNLQLKVESFIDNNNSMISKGNLLIDFLLIITVLTLPLCYRLAIGILLYCRSVCAKFMEKNPVESYPEWSIPEFYDSTHSNDSGCFSQSSLTNEESLPDLSPPTGQVLPSNQSNPNPRISEKVIHSPYLPTNQLTPNPCLQDQVIHSPYFPTNQLTPNPCLQDQVTHSPTFQLTS